MATTRILYYAGPPSSQLKVVQPLLRLMNQSREVERVALVYILIISGTNPVSLSLFRCAFSRPLIGTLDSLLHSILCSAR